MKVNKDFKEVAEDNGGFISLCLIDYLFLILRLFVVGVRQDSAKLS